jgi:tetratricopeptide (TPR) repeat protein
MACSHSGIAFRPQFFYIAARGTPWSMRKLRFGFMVGAAALLATALTASAETNVAPAGKLSAQDETNSLRLSHEEFQQQQQATLRAVEQVRQDATAAKRNTEELDVRLRQLEAAVTTQREHELEMLRSTNQFTLIIVALFAGVSFCGMLIFAVFSLRTLGRRADAGVAQPMGASVGLGYPAATGPGSGATQPVALDPAQQVSARFLSTIERLEKRIHELEGAAETTEPETESVMAVANVQTEPSVPAPAPEPVASAVPHPNTDPAARVALLLGKGQSLLHLQQTDTALACFDEVIAIDPTNAEAFVKKGTALEKLGKLDEAIDCYDRAIALDTSMTMAYLCKGGVFNRLERYGEALQCYEQALRAQQKINVP